LKSIIELGTTLAVTSTKTDSSSRCVSGKIVPFVELTVAHASVLTILAISFERYYAICEPLKASYVCTKARALVICLLAWVLAALFTRFVFLGACLYLGESVEPEMCLPEA
jgi:hypothetical protein